MPTTTGGGPCTSCALGGSRCDLGGDRAAAPGVGSQPSAWLSPPTRLGPVVLPGPADPAGHGCVVGRHRSDPRPPSLRHDPARTPGRVDRRPDRIDYLRARMMCRDLHRSSWAAPGIKTGAPPRPVDGPLLSAYPRES